VTVTRREFVGAAAAAALSQAKAAPNDRISVGMIGTGSRGQELMQAIQKNAGADIVAVCDVYKGRVDRAIERTGGKAKSVPHYKDLLADKFIDAVVIATPDHWHRRMSLDAIAAGKDVYCEKPMTYRAEEGPEIIRAAKSAGRMLQVGSQGVSSDVQQKAKEWIKAGRLGQITMIRAAYNRNTASGAWIYPIPPDASPETVNWEAFLGPAPKRKFDLERFFRWRCYWDYSGGIGTDLFVHLCTTIHYLMDTGMPSSVMAMGQLYRWKESREVPDTLNSLLEYKEGFAVNLSSTFNNQASEGAGFHVLGTEGSLEIGWGTATFHPENVREDNRWIVEAWASQAEKAYWEDPKVKAAELDPRPNREPEVFKGDGTDPTVAHFANFFESMRTRKAYWEDATAGHNAAACAHLTNYSVRKRTLARWDESKSSIQS